MTAGSIEALLEAACGVLGTLGESGFAPAVAFAPGRATLVGEHVDYAGGMVTCIALDLGIAVALRPSPDRTWRVAGGGRRSQRGSLLPTGEIGDLPLAVIAALQEHGVELPPLELAVAASLPEGAGLSSSAAIACATAVAALRLVGARLTPNELAELALHAERDLLGVPCGPLDQRAVVFAPRHGALLLDCQDGGIEVVPWRLEDVALVACLTGERHETGGAAYRARREEADTALRMLGARRYREVAIGTLAGLPEPERSRARHILSETARAVDAAGAIAVGDPARLGRLMSESHRSLRDDYGVSTAALDAVVGAAQRARGCFGARLVGAGFGGAAIALVSAAGGVDCRLAMARAAGVAEASHTWVVGPAPGAAVLNQDVIAGGGHPCS